MTIARHIIDPATSQALIVGPDNPATAGAYAPVGSLYNTFGTGSWYAKFGPASTDWTQLAASSGFLPLSGGTLNAGANLTVPGTLTAGAGSFTSRPTVGGVGVVLVGETVTRASSAANADNTPWIGITGKPTTIGGYGIADFNSLGDARWPLKAGNPTISGAWEFAASPILSNGVGLYGRRGSDNVPVRLLGYDSGTSDISTVLGGATMRWRDTGSGVPMSLTSAGDLTLASGLTTGYVRGPGNGSGFILARNAANTAYVDLLYMDASDIARIPRSLTLGGTLTAINIALGGNTNPYVGLNDGTYQTYLEQVGGAFRIYHNGAQRIYFPIASGVQINQSVEFTGDATMSGSSGAWYVKDRVSPAHTFAFYATGNKGVLWSGQGLDCFTWDFFTGMVSANYGIAVLGPAWTSSGWGRALNVGNGQAIDLGYNNGAYTRFGIGASGGLLYLFTTPDEGVVASPSYRMIYNPASGFQFSQGVELTAGSFVIPNGEGYYARRLSSNAVIRCIGYDVGTDDLSIVIGGNILRFRDTGAGVPASLVGSTGVLTVKGSYSFDNGNATMQTATRTVYGAEFLSGGVALRIRAGGLLVSDSYGDDSLVPSLGIYAKGNMKAANFVLSSDVTLKTAFLPISNALSRVRALTGYTYEFRDDRTRRRAGIIAQDVQRVLPEAVFTQPDGTFAVAYDMLVPLLIEAVKELAAHVHS